LNRFRKWIKRNGHCESIHLIAHARPFSAARANGGFSSHENGNKGQQEDHQAASYRDDQGDQVNNAFERVSRIALGRLIVMGHGDSWVDCSLKQSGFYLPPAGPDGLKKHPVPKIKKLVIPRENPQMCGLCQPELGPARH
jgi:hypothetical protein